MHQVLATFAAIKLDKEYVSRHRDYYLNLAKEGPNAQSQIDKEMGQIVRIVQLTVVELIPMMMRSVTVLPRIL